MRYPDFLPANGTIGFVAPSFGCATSPYREAFLNAQKNWQERGYRLELGPNCYLEEGIGISNTPKACGKELTEFYLKESNQCLISTGGGELMCETMDYVDFEAIKTAKPKWFLGYSDNTNMTFLLATLCDTASIYGPCASSFGMEPWHESLEDTMGLLTGTKLQVRGYEKWEKEKIKDDEHPLAPYQLTQDRVLKKFPNQDSKFSGRLLGGCMDCLVTLLGTKFDKVTEFVEQYKEDGIVWFLEACELNVMSIRRAMWQMDRAGWFQYTRGFLIGRPLCFGQELMGMDAYKAVIDVVEKYNVPIVMDVDLGHLPPMMPLITGSIGEVDVQKNDITITMQLK